MAKSVLKIPLNYIGRYINMPLVLPISITFAVTYKCNSHCMTCNIWKEQYGRQELSLSEINCLFHSFGKSLLWVTLSGGEPFVRKDLPEICQIIYRNCQPVAINIPTNGSLPDRIIEYAKKILKDCPKTKLTINLSIDGIGEKHDYIRGFPGNFDRIITTYGELRNLKHPQLRLGFYTTISNYNINEWKNIFSFSREFLPDSHFFEIAQIRDEFENQNLNHIVPPKEQCIKFLRKIYNFNGINKKDILSHTIHTLRKNYYLLAEKTILFERQIIPCFAALASAFILPDGRVWSCSNHNWLMGDLKEYNFDFKKLWRSKISYRVRRCIKKNRCFCLQANSNHLNMIHSLKYLGKLIYNRHL